MSAPYLITPSEVEALDVKPVILDCSWYLPNSPRKPKIEYTTKRIKGTNGFLDLDALGPVHEMGLKHMMPDGKAFAEMCESFGIGPSTYVIFYDSIGIYSAPRALFTFRAFGHTASSVLDGGLLRWQQEGHPVDTEPPSLALQKSHYPAPAFETSLIVDYDTVLAKTKHTEENELLLDARPAGRFKGIDPEPRAGIKSGCMPNSINVPFDTLLESQSLPDGSTYTKFKSPSEIGTAIGHAIGAKSLESVIKGDAQVYAGCGSGMTVCALWLAFCLIDAKAHISIYDESWTGFALRDPLLQQST